MTAATPSDQETTETHPSAGPTERDTVYSPRTRRAGAVLFLLSGLLGVALGVIILVWLALGGFGGVPPLTVILFVIPILLVAIVQLLGGWAVWRGRRWRVAVGAGVIGLLVSPNPVTIPIKVVALVFVGISEDQFR